VANVFLWRPVLIGSPHQLAIGVVAPIFLHTLTFGDALLLSQPSVHFCAARITICEGWAELALFCNLASTFRAGVDHFPLLSDAGWSDRV